MVKIERTTKQRFTHAKHIGDIVLDANPPTGGDALTNEDVVVIGPWQDFIGSKTISSRNQQMWAGHANELWGTTAHVKSMQDLDNLSAVGTRSDTHRRRRRKIHLEV